MNKTYAFLKSSFFIVFFCQSVILVSQKKDRGYYIKEFKKNQHSLLKSRDQDFNYRDSFPIYYKNVKKLATKIGIKDTSRVIDFFFLNRYYGECKIRKDSLGYINLKKYADSLLTDTKENKNFVLKAHIYLYKSLYYFHLKNTEKAIKHAEEAVQFAKKTSTKTGLIDIYLEYSDVHALNAYPAFYESNFNKVYSLFLEQPALFNQVQKNTLLLRGASIKSIPAKTRLSFLTELLKNTPKKNFIRLSIVHNLLGIYYFYDINEVDKAEKAFLQAVNYAKQSKQNYYLTPVYINLSKLYLQKENSPKAIHYKELAMNTYSENHGLLISLVESFSSLYKLLGDLNFNNKDYKKAATFYKKHIDTLSKKFTFQKDSLVFKYDAQFKLSEKNQKIADAKIIQEQQQSQLYLISFLFLLVLIGIGIYFYVKQNQKITATKLLEKEQELSKYRTEFIENVIHEIKTPLTIINGNIESVLLYDDQPVNKDLLKSSLKSSEKIASNLKNIVHILENKSIHYTKKEVSINVFKFIEGVCKQFEIVANFNHLKIVHASKLPKHLIINLDIEKVEKILTNFITNALKHSFNDTQIIITSSIENDTNLKISITNFGKGIPVAEQEKVFERFYQAKDNNFGGFGIGLALCKDLATSLGGTITLQSELNKETTFSLTVPITFYEDKLKTDVLITEAPIIKLEPNSIKTTKSQKRILLVDDSIEIIEYYKQLLNNEYNCTYAKDGLEALHILNKQSFDLIISDIMMPKMDGFTFREKVKQNPRYVTVPFIFITGKNNLKDKLTALNIGVDDYISKPFRVNELYARIQNALLLNENRKQHLKDTSVNDVVKPQDVDPIVKKAIKIVLKNIANENYSVKSFCYDMNYSQRQLNRVLTDITGLTPVKFILEQRLKLAYSLLVNSNYNTRVSDVRYKVGLASPSYFNKVFKNRFGITPSELLKNNTPEVS